MPLWRGNTQPPLEVVVDNLEESVDYNKYTKEVIKMYQHKLDKDIRCLINIGCLPDVLNGSDFPTMHIGGRKCRHEP